MISYEQFEKAINDLKAYFDEQDKLKSVLNVISPSGTGVCEFGNEFVEAYVKLLSLAVEDDGNWVDWFVFENDFGEKKHRVRLKGDRPRIIKDAKTFYDVCLKR